MKKIIIIASLVTTASLLSSCITIVSNVGQSIAVRTTPINGASCSLQNDKGIWYINSTPGDVSVQRSNKNLIITCKKRGFQDATQAFGAAPRTVVFGTGVFGAFIGGGANMMDNGAYNYPTRVTIPMIGK